MNMWDRSDRLRELSGLGAQRMETLVSLVSSQRHLLEMSEKLVVLDQSGKCENLIFKHRCDTTRLHLM